MMRDFTLKFYEHYIQAIKKSFPVIIRFYDFLIMDPTPDSFCLIRHDVDRRPKKALQMAKMEYEMGIQSTYYFRSKNRIFRPDIIRAISRLGHEIGYHYESLSDAKGDIPKALKDFEFHLERFKKIVPIKTISMHGRPLKPFDNRDLWRDPKLHALLEQKYGIVGEVYLDMDYSDVAYINDTGRNWTPDRSVIRDQIKYGVKLDFAGGEELLDYLGSNPHPRMVFQVHPERWASNLMDFQYSLCFDMLANLAKYAVQKKKAFGF
jgi:hypothetical protein